MSIFNSLGSNYDLDFVFKSISTQNDNSPTELKTLLEKKYEGQALLLYKGREAITLALKLLNLPKDSSVAINGFTCYAVYKSIKEAGLEPILVDIPKDDLNFTRSDLASTLSKNPQVKVVIIQNTLGYPCDIEKIAKICREKNLILIEDLAHSAGGKYENGKEMGTVGDFVVLSFSQDKIIDGITGGALITRNKKYQNDKIDHFEKPPSQKEFTDRLYPLFTYKIRKTYGIGIGKIIHFILKNTHLLSSPMDNNLYRNFLLPNWYCSLINLAFKNLNIDLEHRKKIAGIYKNNLDKRIMSDLIISKIDLSANLRFPIFVENRKNLINYLKKYNIFISDIWYDTPVAPKKYISKINYKDQCPNSEKISSLILNLPTHKNVSEKNAVFITERINEWSGRTK